MWARANSAIDNPRLKTGLPPAPRSMATGDFPANPSCDIEHREPDPMDSNLQATNITAAALLAQFLLVVVISVAAGMVWGSGRPFPYRERPLGRPVLYIPWLIIGFALVSLGLLFFSDAFSATWQPILGLSFPGILTWSSALLVAILLDILLVSILVQATGGSWESIFTPVYFLLPVFAILLREAPDRLLLYFVLVSAAFTWTLRKRHEHALPPHRTETAAYWFVSIACFALATLIGFLTRAP